MSEKKKGIDECVSTIFIVLTRRKSTVKRLNNRLFSFSSFGEISLSKKRKAQMMFIIQIFLLALVALLGLLFNWLLILAIQRKTYHHQDAQRIATPTTNMTLLRPNASLSMQLLRPPSLPSIRSSISTFDKYVLAFLINDVFTCNLLLPLRLIDLSEGLPCIFLCFVMKLWERLSMVTELVIITLLIITSLFFFTKKHLVTDKLSLICFILMIPLIIIYLIPTLTQFDLDESGSSYRPPSCKQIFLYISYSTYQILNLLCCLITYSLLFLHLILLWKVKSAVKKYTVNSLKTITELATLTRNMQQENSLVDQVNELTEKNKSEISHSDGSRSSLGNSFSRQLMKFHIVVQYSFQ